MKETTRQTRAADKITGTFWCLSGHHYARGEYIIHRGRKMCRVCEKRIRATRKERWT